MRLYDTHCHFENCDAPTVTAALKRARTAGVEKLMVVGGSEALNRGAEFAVECAKASAKSLGTLVVKLANGYDRDQVGLSGLPEITASPLAAWGEIGLDYHYSPDTRDGQLRFFAEQLDEARRRSLPVVIHTREADDDTVALLKEIPSRGIIHCYTGTVDHARQFLDLGFYVSISGIVTFRAADNVREVARYIPDDRILIETDAPFLAPVPRRGESNEPAFIEHTCRFLAELRGMAAEDFAELTFANAEKILG